MFKTGGRLKRVARIRRIGQRQGEGPWEGEKEKRMRRGESGVSGGDRKSMEVKS